jgi:tryptophan synthase alpha chain
MSRLEDTFARLRASSQGAFMPFLVLGDPDQQTSLALGAAMIRAGADILEFGFPFSDPPADGPVIQAADQRALLADTTPAACFEMIDALRPKTEAPFALLLYYNLILRWGVDAFYHRAAQAGVDAVLVADLPVEEADAAVQAARKNGIAPIFIASELTPPARLDKILAAAAGYLYVVAHVGITGERAAIDSGLGPTLAALRSRTELPLLPGFGISTPEQVKSVRALGADGVIVGSALVREIERNLGEREAMIRAVEDRARELAAATKER